ncbi:MAG: hypothetical protein R2864_01465 [Syntrophotaleaceae bacterium]
MEGWGAINFLAIDDLSIVEVGEPIDAESVIEMRFTNGEPVFPEIDSSCDDDLLKKIHRGRRKSIIFTDEQGVPHLTMDPDALLRAAIFEKTSFNPRQHCHRPIILYESGTSLGEAILKLKVHPERPGDDVIDKGIILFWGDLWGIITGSDILGRLSRGIVQHKETSAMNG